MRTQDRVSIGQRARLGFESFFLTKLIPRDRIPPFERWLFRLPLFFQRIGLHAFIPENVIILTTTGRKTGIAHRTPVEAGPGPRPGSLLIMAGWDGRTDWYRNARKEPAVQVWQHGKEWEATAEPVPDAEVAAMLKQLSGVSGTSDWVWSRWSGEPIDGSEASYLRAAPHFPSLYLNPVDPADRAAQVEEARRLALDLLDCTRRDSRALLRRLNPDAPAQQDGSKWSVRDVLGHIGAWNAEAARSLQAHADGGQYICVGSEAEYDDYNGPAADERSRWAIEEVWTEYETAHDELRKALETMPAERWRAAMVYPWNERGTVERLVKIMMKHESADHVAQLAIEG